MKAVLLACSLLSLSGLWGCATSSAVDEDGGIDGALLDSGQKTDSGNKDSGGAGQCVPDCTSDLDCQNSCPSVPNGINCCDSATGICYANASSTCPVPVDAGFD